MLESWRAHHQHRAGCHPPLIVIAQCNDCTLQSLPLLFFSLPRRVNHHTSASLHPPPSTPAPATHNPPGERPPARRNAPKTSHPGSTAFLHPQPVVVTALCNHCIMQSPPCSTSSSLTRRSHPTTTTPKNQQAKKPASREAGKSECWKVGNPRTQPATHSPHTACARL